MNVNRNIIIILGILILVCSVISKWFFDFFVAPLLIAGLIYLLFWKFIVKFDDWTRKKRIDRKDYFATKKLTETKEKIKERESNGNRKY